MNLLFISLGCDKNLVDSEVMLGILDEKGWSIVDDEAQADVIVINTCCFIHDAKEESIETILEMAEYKKEGRLKALIVTGCLAQRYQREILEEIPEVDAVLGTTSYDKIAEAIEKALAEGGVLQVDDLSALPLPEAKRLVTTGGHYAYLKIAEGCDKHCTYCIIPKLRGNYRSVPMERLVKEAEDLAKQGVKELILVAQETTVYGQDLYGEKSLPRLLRELCKIQGIWWIRLLYCYPEEVDEELIQVMKEEPKICHYIDLPIQHASDEILKRMGRRTSRAELVEIIGKLREAIPDIAIRTTLITGFPGETKEQQEELTARNHLLQKAYQKEAERRKTEEQNRLLNMIQNQTAGQLELLSQFMDELERTESREQYDWILGKIVVVGTYLKRRKNLVLTQYASDGNLLTMEDLRQSLAESCDSLKLCRIRAAYYVENVDVQMNADDILKCYDTFEWLVERLLDTMQSVFYRVSQIDDALRVSVHIVSEADLRGFISERPELKVQQEDENEWFISCIVFRKRGGR